MKSTCVVNRNFLILWDDGDDDDYDDDVDDVDDVDDDSETGVVNGHLLVLWGTSLLLRIRPVQVDNLISKYFHNQIWILLLIFQPTHRRADGSCNNLRETR